MSTQSIGKLFDFKGKGAIVTGGNAGIGQGIAFRLAEAGAGVIIAARNQETADQTVEQIKARGGKAKFVRSDTRVAADGARLAQAAVDAFGSLDILVNNAGIFPVAPVLEITEEVWDNVIDTNLKGAFFFCQAAAKQMIKAGRGGKIINIASMQAYRPIPGNSTYGASKGGMISLTYGLALELATYGIRANCIAPGGIATGGIANTFSGPNSRLGRDVTVKDLMAMAESQKAAPKLGGMGDPDDIAMVALFLASPASDFVNGTTVLVDNGMMLTR